MSWRRAALVIAGPVLAAVIGVLTNWLSSEWEWGLFAALVALVAATAAVGLYFELSTPRSPANPGLALAGGAGALIDLGPNLTGGVVGLRDSRNQLVTSVRTIPRDVGDFTGRDAEVRYLLQQLDAQSQSGSTAIAIHAVDGMAGIGKTALAVHIAHRLASRFEDLFFLDLRAHTEGRAPMDPAEALEILLVTAGVPGNKVPDRLEARVAKWRAEMAGRRALIILDNASSEEQVRHLLPGALECLVLITSRNRLTNLEGVPTLTLATLPIDDAVDLFTRIVGPARQDADRDAVTDVVTRCGRLPLAIRLAAAWLRHHPAKSIQDLRERLSETLGPVSAAFELSYRDLPEAQRTRFRRLALHPGPDLTVEVTAVLADIPADQARQLLDELYAKHLITEPSGNRYRFHDLIRKYGRDLADAEDSAEDRRAALARLLDYYLVAAEGAEHEQDFPWLVREAPNLVACTEYAVDAEVVPYAWRLPQALSYYLGVRGLFGVARTLFAGALKAAEHAGDLAAQARVRRELGAMNILGGNFPQARVDLNAALMIYAEFRDLQGQADIDRELGALGSLTADYAVARTHLSSALAFCEQLDDRPGMAKVHTDYGGLDRFFGDYEPALAHFSTALTLYTELGDLQGQAGAHRDLGLLALLTDDYPIAGHHLGTALRLYTDLGQRVEQATMHRELAVPSAMVGDYGESRDHLDTALRIFTEIGDKPGQATVHHELGVLGVLTGDEAAGLHLGTALGIYTELDDRPGKAHSGRELAAFLTMTGENQRAKQLLEAALTSYVEVSDQLGQANAHKDLGTFGATTGAYDDGVAHLSKALEIYRHLGDRMGVGTALQESGVLNANRGDYAAARADLDGALRAYRAIGDRMGAAHTLLDLAVVEACDDRPEQARAHLEAAREVFARTGDRLGLATVDDELGIIEHDAGNRALARAHWERALAGYTAIGDPEAAEVQRRLRRR